MTPTDLRTRLAGALTEFEELHKLIAAAGLWAPGLGTKFLSDTKAEKMQDDITAIYRAGAKSYARLAPLHSALAELAGAAQTWCEQVDTHGGDYLPGNRKQIGEALARLGELLGEGEG